MTKPTLAGAAQVLIVSALIALAAGCPLDHDRQATVSWTIEGSNSPSLCSTYSIDRFRIRLARQSATTRCSDRWAVDFQDVLEEKTQLTLEALDASGATLAKKTAIASVSLGGYIFHLMASDFGSGPGARIGVLWNINGSIAGEDKAPSWDRCAEVGAKTTVIKVDGATHRVDCSASGVMSTTLENLLDGKTYDLKVKLEDATGKDLTTEATGRVVASKAGGQFVADFFYDAFYSPLDDETKGVFHFKLTFAGAGCGEHSPAVGTIRLGLFDEHDFQPVKTHVCDADGNACVAADGISTFDCSDALLTLSEAVWGTYTLRIAGFDAGNTSAEPTWSKRQEILIGAGVENPVVVIDVPAAASP